MFYHNPNNTASIPDSIGDRFYAQDIFRNFRYNQNMISKLYQNAYGDTNNFILSGLEVIQGTGHTINITSGDTLINFQVEIQDDSIAWAIPPTIKNETIKFLTSVPTQTNLSITSANTDNVTTNYVKVSYVETAGRTRTKARGTGSYNFEVEQDFLITVNDTAPTTFETTISTFRTNGATIVFLSTGDSRHLNSLSLFREVTVEDGSVTIDNSSGNAVYYADSVSTTVRGMITKTSGMQRWSVLTGAVAETGSDLGSDFEISNYNDAGTFISTPFFINRATSRVGLHTITPAAEFDVRGDCMVGSDNLTDSTNKVFIYAANHFSNSEEPISAITSFTNSTENIIYLGGGAGQANAATELDFRTSVNSTTVGGIQRLRIDKDGKLATGGELLPGCDPGGITIDHGTNDGKPLTVENDDSNHGMTDFAKTTEYAFLRKGLGLYAYLDIVGLAEGERSVRIEGNATIEDTTTNASSSSPVLFSSWIKNGTGHMTLGATGNILAAQNGTSTRMILKGNGDLHIDGVYLTYSDKRLKSGIMPSVYGIEQVLKMRPVQFSKIYDNPNVKHIGFIAQDIKPLIPELVHGEETEDSNLSMDYSGFIPVLVKAMQQQNEKIQKHSSDMDKLENKIKMLEQNIDNSKVKK